MMPSEFDSSLLAADDMADDEDISIEDRIALGEAMLVAMLAEIAGRYMALEDLERAARELVLSIEEMKAAAAKRDGALQ